MSELVPLDRLRPYLREKIGVERIDGVRKTPAGQSNPTFVLTTDRGLLVLRRKPPGTLLKSAHAVEREYRVMAALAGRLPVPQMLHLCEDEAVIGAAFFVMRHVAGQVFDDPRCQGLDNDGRRAVYDTMNSTLAALHRVDVAAAGLEDYGKPGHYFRRQLSRWTRQYRDSQTGAIADMEALIGWLEANMPAEAGRLALVHGDWRIDNLIFAGTPPAVAAVLDWELSTLGDPLADLGAQLMQWRMPPGAEGRGLAGVDRGALGLPEDAAYVERYAARVGLADVPDMRFAVAFAFFRMAAILQGVKKRALDGNASNPEKAMKLGTYVPAFARGALDYLNAAA